MDKQKWTTRQKIAALNSPEPDTRRVAAYGLRYARSDAAVTALIRALDDPEPRVRQAAASALWDHPRALQAVPKLIDLLDDPDVRVAGQSATALGYLRDKRAFEPLCNLLSKRDDMRHSVARALADIGDPRAFPKLVEAFRRCETSEERSGLWTLFGKIGCADEAKPLSYLIESEGWTAAAEDRRALVEPAERPPRRLPEREVTKIKADIEELASADSGARDRAISRLGRRRGLVVELLAEASASPNIVTRCGVLYTLGQVGDPRAYPVVLEMTKDPVSYLRWHALEFLGELGKERAIPYLTSVLEKAGPDDCENFGAADGLEAIGAAAVPAVTRLVKDGPREARLTAAYILGTIGGAAAIGPLSGLLRDSDQESRLVGVDSLGVLGEDHPDTLTQCLSLIEGMVADPDDRVRKTASSWLEDLQEAARARQLQQ